MFRFSPLAVIKASSAVNYLIGLLYQQLGWAKQTIRYRLIDSGLHLKYSCIVKGEMKPALALGPVS